MKNQFMNSPSIEDLLDAGTFLMEGFLPKSLVYLDSAGQWKKNPESLRDCVSNEILYYLWKRGVKERAVFIRDASTIFLRKDIWTMTKKIIWVHLEGLDTDLPVLKEKELDVRILSFYSKRNRAKKILPFLIVLEGLAWVVSYEACRLNSSLNVPSWDANAKRLQQHCAALLEHMKKLMDPIFTPLERDRYVADILEYLNTTAPEFLQSMTSIIAEEQRLDRTIRFHLEKLLNEAKSEDIFPLIIEKILPPMGIVNQTSPALMRPCIRLLSNTQIEIESGIQYHASVILSILQDPRSTEAILNALERIPFNFSKIRENLIYALGSLQEPKAVNSISAVLGKEDQMILTTDPLHNSFCLLIEQKEEAILALGKIGLPSLQVLVNLIKYAEHHSPKLQTCLAWTLGEIGKFQKMEYGGVSADIIITLLQLLKTKQKKVFEECVHSLKKIDMPEFIHSLYLYNLGAVNILGLKPSQKGLYELSETIHFLIKEKNQAIIAVNGDSGTGKTYFCQSLMDGFGDIKKSEILYMMRDRKKDQKVFNRILGLKWLRSCIDPVYYHDYPLAEEEDNPEEFLDEFLVENAHKKLIILDGCRDLHYFQKVIDLFYFRGKLDVEVNFRATQSTRRFNLEEREVALESVRTHLSFLEEPSLEDTYIYREGKAILFDLDNSIGCRINREEIQELFAKARIESWGDLIRIGDFNKERHPLHPSTGKLCARDESFSIKTYGMAIAHSKPLFHEERKFCMMLNQNISEDPHLIGTIDTNDLKPKKIRFYAQDQIAGLGLGGTIFILTFLDNRIFSTIAEGCQNITLLGRKIFSIGQAGECALFNFEKNEKIRLAKTDSPALVSAALSTDRVITGHQDGSIIIWNLIENTISLIKAHDQPVLALDSDYDGQIYSSSSDLSLKRWHVDKGQVRSFSGFSGFISRIEFYPQKKILAITEENGKESIREKLRENLVILDPQRLLYRSLPSPVENKLNSVNVHFDGRIFATSCNAVREDDNVLVFISCNENSWGYKILDSHERDTKDCLIMGPKLITCGTEAQQNHTIRIWGSKAYVKNELNKMIALSERT
jgi:hypothetical protein